MAHWCESVLSGAFLLLSSSFFSPLLAKRREIHHLALYSPPSLSLLYTPTPVTARTTTTTTTTGTGKDSDAAAAAAAAAEAAAQKAGVAADSQYYTQPNASFSQYTAAQPFQGGQVNPYQAYQMQAQAAQAQAYQQALMHERGYNCLLMLRRLSLSRFSSMMLSS